MTGRARVYDAVQMTTTDCCGSKIVSRRCKPNLGHGRPSEVSNVQLIAFMLLTVAEPPESLLCLRFAGKRASYMLPARTVLTDPNPGHVPSFVGLVEQLLTLRPATQNVFLP